MAPKVVSDLVFSPLFHLSVPSEQHLPCPKLLRESCLILDLELDDGNLFWGEMEKKVRLIRLGIEKYSTLSIQFSTLFVKVSDVGKLENL